MLRATTACTFSTSQLQKVVRSWCVLYILTWKCASRHNGVHFFDIATSKSGPRMVCFVHFDLDMCFAPQRRALFRHLNFQKWSDIGVFCTFWLGNVLRATTACNFSSLIWPAGSAPAALASLLFDPPEPQIIGKTQCFATFSVSRRSYLFAHLHLLSSDLFSSDSSHLCFSTVHIVGSFTSKLPSIICAIERASTYTAFWDTRRWVQLLEEWGVPTINIPGIPYGIPLTCWNIFFGIRFLEHFGIFLARGIWYPPSDYTWNIFSLELPISLEYVWIYFFWLSDIFWHVVCRKLQYLHRNPSRSRQRDMTAWFC